MMLPDFLCVGAPKSGTTWLFDCLKGHPEIFIPAEKEIHFFNEVGVDVYQTKGIEWYARFYRDARPGQLLGDMTPNYLREPYVPMRIKRTLPECRLIALLRNPVERAYSDYWMLSGRGLVNYTFDELVAAPQKDPHRILSTGLYGEQLQRFRECFSKDRMLIVLTDEIRADGAAVLKRVLEFLGISTTYRPPVVEARPNQASELRSPQLYRWNYKVARGLSLNGFDWVRRFIKRSGVPGLLRSLNTSPRKYPPLTEEHRKALASYYRADIAQLSLLLGRNLDHWLQLSDAPAGAPATAANHTGNAADAAASGAGA